jgi:parallel beta-helix repeat protein
MARPKKPNPRIFISYSHDSTEHSRRVRALADQLRKDGIDARIDQYTPDPDEGWSKWMRTQVKEADRVLLVFTETYQRRYEGDEEQGKGQGATFEGVIVTQVLYEGGGFNTKFRPVVFREEDERFIPVELRRFNRYRVDTQEHYQNLLRWLYQAPSIVAPTIGQKPELPIEQAFELFQVPTRGQKPELPTEQAFELFQVPTHVVDQDAFHRGDRNHLTICAALKAAAPGDRILVRPGLYKEGLVVDKPVEIIGEGDRNKVEIEATRKHTVSFRAAKGRIANLTLRQTGGGEWYCVDIAGGCLELEGCDITGDGQGGIAIHEEADPKLINNHIHRCKNGGVDAYERGKGMLKNNRIYGNGLAGVAIRGDANPILHHNYIYDGNHEGVWVADHGQGTLEENDIYGNRLAGVAIRGDGNPTLRQNNRIHDGEQEGVWVGDGGRGTLEDNEIFRNRVAGVAIVKGGNPTLRRNNIRDGKQEGVWVGDGGEGTLKENNIHDNVLAGVAIVRDGNPTLHRNRIYNGKGEGVYIHEGGRGVISRTDNEVYGNAGGDWDISEDCKDKVKWV